MKVDAENFADGGVQDVKAEAFGMNMQAFVSGGVLDLKVVTFEAVAVSVGGGGGEPLLGCGGVLL